MSTLYYNVGLPDFDRHSRPFRSSFPREGDAGFRTNAWREGVARSADELKPLYPTLLHALAHAARDDDRRMLRVLPDRPGDPEVARSWRQVYHGAQAMAAGLAARGVSEGDRVLLVLPTCAEFVEAFFAVQLLGAIPVPSYPPAAVERAREALRRLRHVASCAEAAYCVTSKRLRPLLGELLGGGIRDLVTVEALAESKGRAPERKYRGEQPAFIQYTSGSTDRPKGVLLTQTNLVSNLHAIGQAMRINRSDSVLSWLPLYHDMGLIGALLFAIYWKVDLTLMSPLAFLADPLRWLRELTRTKATLSPAPNFAFSLCLKRAAAEDLSGIDLSSWRVACNGAEPVHAATLREFHRVFRPRGFRSKTMLPVYGLAEASLAVTFPPVDAAPAWESVDRAALADGRAVLAKGTGAMEVVSVGVAVPGHRVAIVDEHGAPLPDREVGHIVAAGPSVMKEYFRAPEATSAVLRGDLLWTGDLGYTVDGTLYVTGRAKDLIIVRGRNYYAEDVERVAATVDGVRPGGVAAFGVLDEAEGTELAVLVCETRVTDPAARVAMVKAIGDAVVGRVQVPLDEVVLAAPGTIPKTPSGKPQRHLCRQLYLSEQLGRARTTKLGLALVFARSGAGFLAAGTRRLLRRRAPE